jgi:hypothetical protein
MRQDLRDAFRGLRRAPTFTLVAVITLALAIGSTTAVFSVVDAVLIRGLPYAQPIDSKRSTSAARKAGCECPRTQRFGTGKHRVLKPAASLKEWRSFAATASRSPAATTATSPHTSAPVSSGCSATGPS